MLCGCFSGTGRLVTIKGTMNGAKYRHILNENCFRVQTTLDKGRWLTFQQDNDPKNTAKANLVWLQYKNVTVLEWPSQSPDLNRIEHLWKDLKIAVPRRSPSSLTELEKICKEEWEKISKSRCVKLIQTYQRRLKAVIAAEGAFPKYWLGCEYLWMIYFCISFSIHLQSFLKMFSLCYYGILCLDGWEKSISSFLNSGCNTTKCAISQGAVILPEGTIDR